MTNNIVKLYFIYNKSSGCLLYDNLCDNLNYFLTYCSLYQSGGSMDFCFIKNQKFFCDENCLVPLHKIKFIKKNT